MIEKILRALGGARSDRVGRNTRTLYHWRCSCGGHSRGPGGWLIPADAEYAAQRHQWNKGVGHQMPEVYSTEEEAL
ncbi:hypothetical protein [Micromonospora luteifusca]|uniref:hypothetical protein n=1 Tax=Micromonospora luteifusca TaxID=709860 RepID=UPI0033A23377